MHNVEYKAELRDRDLARAICLRLGASCIGTFEQVDTYFNIPAGRLKKRQTDGEEAEYVFYDRPDVIRPRLSHFNIYTEEAAATRFGTSPLPVRVMVRKRRELFVLRHTRIHLDEVEGIGSFVEVEVFVTPDRNLVHCHADVARMKQALAVALGEPISCSYADLAEAAAAADAEGAA